MAVKRMHVGDLEGARPSHGSQDRLGLDGAAARETREVVSQAEPRGPCSPE